MNKETKTIIESLEAKAQLILLKEYSLKNKAQLGALVKFLYTKPINKEELKAVTDFYRFDSDFPFENDLIYNEFKEKLLDIASKNNVDIPKEIL